MDNKLFFEKVNQFIEPNNEGLIEVAPFLEASKSIVQFVDLLGSTFKPVKNDIEGNINKLTKLYESDSSKYKYLNLIVKIEKETLKESEFHIGSDALLWLNRALKYNQLFLTFFVKEYTESGDSLGKLSEDISKHFSLAYELSLKKHHNWFVQKIFSICLMAAPGRTSLLGYLGYLEGNLPLQELRDLIVKSFQDYLDKLKSNTDAISVLLLSHGYQP